MAKTALPEVRINWPPQIYRCGAGWSWRPPPLPDFDFWYVLDGAGEVRWNGTSHSITAQTCFVFTPGSKIKASQDLQHRLRVFAVRFDWCGRQRFRFPSHGIHVRDAVFFAALARRCEASYRLGGSWSRRQSASLVAQMLLHLCAEAEQPAAAATDARIANAVELIREEPGRRWLVTELARRAGLSRSQFTRRFTAVTGVSPERFLIQTRIERASQLLRETRMSVGQIADALGYCDVYHFSRQYRQITGQPATAYRGE